MTSQALPSSRAEVPFRNLPWLIAGIFLVLYLLTMSRGTGVGGLAPISKVTGWDWEPALLYPLYFLVTLPFEWLPVALQPLALNAFSALLAAGTLALVARAVQLLPHDRTRDQRERERSRHSLLTGPAAWLPATTAAAMCGLQLLFWQQATNASVDMLNLFVLAWVIRELLEFRLDHRDGRLIRLAFIYGLGVTSNPALIALFPFMLGAIIWVLGRAFFRSPLLLKLFTAGVSGLLLYLFLPLLATASGTVELTFWEALRENLRTQKMTLQAGFNQRLFPLIMCLGSLFPLIIIGVRWPGSMGDTSAAGNLLTRLMFRVLALLYLLATLAMNFQLKHAVKAQTETGLSYHSLFLLSALVLGYAVGYLLVIFGKPPGKSWQKPGPLGEFAGKAMVGLAWLILPFVVVGLIRANYSKVRASNHSPLYDYAARVAAQMPAQPALVLSDDNFLLALVADRLAHARQSDHWLVHTRSLSAPAYHRHLNETTAGAWPTVPADQIVQGNVADLYLVRTVANLATNRPVVYLHPSFGYYFEWFHPVPDRFVYRLERYTNTTIRVPLPAADEIASHGRFLQSYWDETMVQVRDKVTDGRASVADSVLAQLQSRAFNDWGVRLQQANQFAEATPWFERAVQLFTNNVSALINLEFNRYRLAGATNVFAPSEKAQSVAKNYRGNNQLLLMLGGPIDEPANCIALGNVFAQGNLTRQAAQQFLRALDLTPNNQYARVQLARTFLQAQVPDRALDILKEIRATSGAAGLNEFARIDLASIEASALFGKGEFAKAHAILDELADQFPRQPVAFEVIAQLYLNLATRRTTPEFVDRAERAAQRHHELDATNLTAVANLGTLAQLKQNWSTAEARYTEVLARDPEAQGVRFNRAVVRLLAGQLDLALEDYQLLAEKLPDAPAVQFGLGEIADKQSRSDDALQHFTRYLELAPRGTAEYTNVVTRVEKLRGR